MSARAAWRLETLGFTQVFRFTAGKNNWFAAGWPVEGTRAALPRAGDVTRTAIPTCRLTDRIGTVRAQLAASEEPVCLVVNEANVVLGRLRGNAWAADPMATAEAVMEAGPTTIRPDTPLADIARRLRERRTDSVLVTDPDGALIGILHREDAERRLLEAPPRAPAPA